MEFQQTETKPVLDTDTHLSPQRHKHKLLSGGLTFRTDPLKDRHWKTGPCSGSGDVENRTLKNEMSFS